MRGKLGTERGKVLKRWGTGREGAWIGREKGKNWQGRIGEKWQWVVTEREKVQTTGKEKGGSWLQGVENGREGAGTERGKVEKVRQNENSLKREV